MGVRVAGVSGRKLWAINKAWLTMLDAPETFALAALLGLTLGQGFYTMYRMYCTPAGEAFPNLEVRRDPEKQVMYGPQTVGKSIYYRIAQWRQDEHGWNTGVFDNRGRPYEYNLPTKTLAHSGPQYETDAAVKVAIPE